MPAEAEIREALRDVEDPEFPISVVDLGLVRGIEVQDGAVRVKMTFTSVACPCTHMIAEDVRERIRAFDDVRDVEVEEVFEAWSRDDVSPEGRMILATLAVM